MLAVVTSLTLHCKGSIFPSLLNELLTDNLNLLLSPRLISDFPILIFILTDGLTCICSLTEGARTQLTCKTILSTYIVFTTVILIN